MSRTCPSSEMARLGKTSKDGPSRLEGGCDPCSAPLSSTKNGEAYRQRGEVFYSRRETTPSNLFIILLLNLSKVSRVRGAPWLRRVQSWLAGP